MFHIQFGRSDSPEEAQTRTREGLRIRSYPTDNTRGLGVLDEGVEYFFRVAIENENGLGPFSEDMVMETFSEGLNNYITAAKDTLFTIDVIS